MMPQSFGLRLFIFRSECMEQCRRWAWFFLPSFCFHKVTDVHPSLRLVLWIAAVLFVQRLAGFALAGFLALAYLTAGRLVRMRWSALVWRSRWLLLVLGLTYLLSTPGEAIYAGYWPTWEGLLGGTEQGGRLVAVLGAVAWLLVTTPAERLVAGIYGLGLFLRGGHRASSGRTERAAVRLALVLRYAESAKASDWRDLLQPAAGCDGDPVVIDLPAMVSRDWALLGLTLLLVAGWWG